GRGGGGGGAAGAGGAGGGDDQRVVAVNFTTSGAPVDLPPGEWAVEVSTGVGGEGLPPVAPGGREGRVAGRVSLGPDEAVILRPAVQL
ncbi:MAG TPA: hypothetical protein VGL49_07025, partial [Acidimicrobiales bacterium]